ncbi:Hypothetical_protein [Hexamita inflata]|uniref:Hypothetical_protein n=1 Tax=Hexamita inflata TaxID=28002 RepID=A0AA86QHC5_9EUKA|nr:Hypothetical protein HINF_LOCUS40794 [Hexamita inflata]
MNKFDIKKHLLTTLRRSVFLTYSKKLQLPSVLVLQSTKRGLRNMWQSQLRDHHYQNGLNQIQEVLFSRPGLEFTVVRTNHQLEIMYSESFSASLHTSILFYILAQMN